MKGNDFLSIRDFSPDEILYFLILARADQGASDAYSDALKRKTLALIFEKPSLRTRVSFDVGIQQLGGFSVYLSPAEINLGKRESVYDVAKNLERMVQGIMIRTFAHEIVEQHGGVREHSRHQWSHRLQPSLPGDGRLSDHLGDEGQAGRAEVGVRGRRQQRGALADVCRRAVGRARCSGNSGGLRTQGRRREVGASPSERDGRKLHDHE